MCLYLISICMISQLQYIDTSFLFIFVITKSKLQSTRNYALANVL